MRASLLFFLFSALGCTSTQAPPAAPCACNAPQEAAPQQISGGGHVEAPQAPVR